MARHFKLFLNQIISCPYIFLGIDRFHILLLICYAFIRLPAMWVTHCIWCHQDGRVNALYSTPSIYTDAKHTTESTWPIKTDDFFPWVFYLIILIDYESIVLNFCTNDYWMLLLRYADRVNGYWTGYYTSRPALKRYVRMMSGYYLVLNYLNIISKWTALDYTLVVILRIFCLLSGCEATRVLQRKK